MLAEDDVSLTARTFAVTLTIDVSGESADAILRLAVAGGRFAVTSTGRVVPRRPAPRGGAGRRRRRRPLVLLPRRPHPQRPGQPHRRARGRPEAGAAHREPLRAVPRDERRRHRGGARDRRHPDARPGRALGRGSGRPGDDRARARGTSVRPTSPSGPPRRTGSAWSSTPGWSPVAASSSGTPPATTSAPSSCSSGRSASRRSACCRRATTGRCSCCCTPRSRRCRSGSGSRWRASAGCSASIGRSTSTSSSTGCGPARSTTCCSRPTRSATRRGSSPRLRQLFPMRRNTLTVGPMVDVHWGKPVIITARLAVLIQLDNALGGGPLAAVQGRRRRAAARRRRGDRGGPGRPGPRARSSTSSGFWDLAEKRYGFLAALRDSSVAGIDLTGGLAVWGEYGDHPSFLLAAGGFNPRFKDVPADHGRRRRPARGVVLGRPVRPDAGRVLRRHARDDPGRAQPHGDRQDRAGRARGRDRLRRPDLPPPPHALHRRLPVLRRGHLPRAQPGRGQGGRHHRGSRAAGTSWGRSASRSSGGTSPSRSTSRGEPRRRWSASRSTSVRCWPPSWPSRRTGPPRSRLAGRPWSRWPRDAATSPRRPPARPLRLRPAGRAAGPGHGPVRRRGGLRTEPVRRRGGDRRREVPHRCRHADRRPAGTRALRPRAVRRGVRGRTAHQARVRAPRRGSRVHLGRLRRQHPTGPDADELRDPLPRPRDRRDPARDPAGHQGPRPRPRGAPGVRAVRRRRPRRPARRRADLGGPHPARGRRAAGGGRRPRHPGPGRPGRPGDHRRGRWSSSGCGGPGSPRRSSSASSWRTGSRGRLHVPALGPPRPRRSNPTRRARPAAARPGHRRRRRDPDRHPRVPVHARPSTGRATSWASTPGSSSGPTRGRTASTSSPTTCRSSSSTRPTCRGCSRRPRARRTTGCGRGACWSSSTSPSSNRRGPNPACRCPCSRCPAPSSTPSCPTWPSPGPGRIRRSSRPTARTPAPALAARPAMNVSRLLAPRRLQPGRRYAACLVPAFDAGVVRGLGGEPDESGPLGPAWPVLGGGDVRLPVYYSLGVRHRLGRRRLRVAGQPAAAVRRPGGRRRRADVHRGRRSRAAGQGRRRPRRIPRHGRCAARLPGQQRAAGRGARRRHRRARGDARRGRRPGDVRPDGDHPRARPAALRRVPGAPAHRAGRPAPAGCASSTSTRGRGPRPGSAPSWSGRTRRTSSSGAGSRCRRSSTPTSCSAGPGCPWRR